MAHNTFFQEFVNPFFAGNIIIRAEHYMRYVFAREVLSKQPGETSTVYDLGCGDGYGARIFAEQNKETLNYIGFDISDDLLSLAKPLTPQTTLKTNFFKSDLDQDNLSTFIKETNLPIPNLVTAFEILEHLENPKKVLGELYSLLPTEGLLLLSVPNEQYEPKKNGKPKNSYHKQLFSEESITYLVKESGFTEVVVYGQPRANTLYHKARSLIRILTKLCNALPFILPLLAAHIAPVEVAKTKKSYSIILKAQK